MRFRHPTGARLALPGGQVAFVGKEWTELSERFEDAARQSGCEVAASAIHEPESRKMQVYVNPAVRQVLRTQMIRAVGSGELSLADYCPNLRPIIGRRMTMVFTDSMALQVWEQVREEFRVTALLKERSIEFPIRPNADVQPEAAPPASVRRMINPELSNVRPKQVREALIRMIERNDKRDITAGGLPNLKTLQREVGFHVSREIADATFKALQAEALADAD